MPDNPNEQVWRVTLEDGTVAVYRLWKPETETCEVPWQYVRVDPPETDPFRADVVLYTAGALLDLILAGLSSPIYRPSARLISESSLTSRPQKRHRIF